MKCKVCGAESGKYPLCRACNIKKEKGEIIKCAVCGQWHYTVSPCSMPLVDTDNDSYLYDLKKALISKSEQGFFGAIRASVPEGYCVFPQINLASFIKRTDGARFQNELFRNVDFLITDGEYRPKIVVEINDQTHLNYDRRERDEKVRKICEEAGIPILKLWTSYGVNEVYIKGKIYELLEKAETLRVHHFRDENTAASATPSAPQPFAQKSQGCYVATCVYGSYDCPPVWTLRRYRDFVLSRSCLGRAFIRLYYAISPMLVSMFGERTWFKSVCKMMLDKTVVRLQNDGYEDTPYND